MTNRDASVAEALGRTHAGLLDDLQRLEDTARRTPAGAVDELRNALSATRAHVARHFQIEEQDNYLAVVRRREPRLARAIDQLAEEHCELRESLHALIGNAAQAKSLDTRLRNETLAWINQLRKHEEHENHLVQDAFELDIGAED